MQILRLGRFILPAVAAVLVLWVLLEQVEVSGRYELSFPERHRAVELTDMTPAPSRGTAVAVARSVSPAAGHPPAGTEGTQDDAGENAIEGVEAPAPGLGLTSVAQLDARYYVLASNRGLMLLDRDNAVACRIHVAYPFDGYRTNHGPLDGPPAPGDPSPTGVFIDSAGDLYVADGGADRVLRGSVDPERCRVRIETAYSSSFALGPRNLFADRGRDLLVSANHDSGTVSAFRLSNRELLWTAEVPGAHGVAIQGDKVYATSLITRMVYALDLRDGKQLRARGYPGWDPMRAGYLKPTSIHPFGDRELILTDAHSGFVSFLRARKLKVSRYTGGNGPSSRWLNHPYAAVPIGGGIVVVSSLRDQILFLDPDGRRILESFSFGREHWRDESPRGRPMGEGWGAYHSVEGPGLSIRGRSYELGFGRVNPPDNGSGSAPILTIRGFDDFL